MSMAGQDEESPLVVEEDMKDGGSRAKVMDNLLDRTGYGFFHIVLILGNDRW